MFDILSVKEPHTRELLIACITPCHVLTTKNFAHALKAKRLRMRDEDFTAICDRTKKKNEAGISTRAFPLESPSKNE